jgi:hypothetical protein
MSHAPSSLPALTVNRSFMHAFLAADPPCFALGLVEEHKRQHGFLALRPDEAIPAAVADRGFNFGHSLLGTAAFEVIQFAFEFYGFQTYNVLVNPHNPTVQTVVANMIESGDFFFFALNPDDHVFAFRTEIGQETLAGLKANLPRIQRSTTTDRQYRQALAQFSANPTPAGSLLTWVCREPIDYLDLTTDRMALTPVG